MKAIIVFLFSVIVCHSCKKFVEVESPIDQITSDKVFENDKTASSALAGIYMSMANSLTTAIISNGAVTIYTGLASDEFYYTGTATADQEFANNSISASNSLISANFWRYAYQFIYQANAVIGGIEKSTTLTPDSARQLLGEAKFLRAFVYFYLVNLFGDVPLITSTNYQVNATLPRATASLVYDAIINDLLDAKTLLSSEYPTPGKLRVNKWAAVSLLARVYLYTRNWTRAEEEASLVINSGKYTLLSSLGAVFLPNSNESIWQLFPFASTFATTEGNKFIPSTSASIRPAFPFTPGFINSFEQGDLRKSNWINSKTVSNVVYHYPYKYKVRIVPSNTPPTEYTVMLRYAELFLIRAEARTNLNKLTDAAADINQVRQRANLQPIQTSLSKEDLLSAIEKERRMELFAEWGHRWFDIKRAGRADALLSSLKTDWQSADILFPIPQSQIELNPLLTQNPGY